MRAVASLGLGFGLSLARQYRARFSGFAEAETNPGRARPGYAVLTDEVVALGRVAINPNRISRVVPPVSGRVVKGMATLGGYVERSEPCPARLARSRHRAFAERGTGP